MVETYIKTAAPKPPKTSSQIFVEFLKANWQFAIIIAIFNLGAGLALFGLFVGNMLAPATTTTNVTKSQATVISNSTALVTFDSSTTTAPFICFIVDVIHNYTKCLNELKPLRDLCNDSCPNETVVCQNACFSKYGTDLKTCPCQVSSKFTNILLWKIKEFCQPGCLCPDFDCLDFNKESTELITTRATTEEPSTTYTTTTKMSTTTEATSTTDNLTTTGATTTTKELSTTTAKSSTTPEISTTTEQSTTTAVSTAGITTPQGSSQEKKL